MVTVLQVFCAVDFYIVFDSYDREAGSAVWAGRATVRPPCRRRGEVAAVWLA